MSGTLYILVVDDDRRMAQTLADILKVKGYRAEVAHSGAEALEKIKGAGDIPFDCILTDVKMPEMSGVELNRAIKAINPTLPVVFMTAYAQHTIVEQGLKEGAIASLSKPLDLNLLLGFFSFLRQKPMLVIIDDDPMFCKSLRDILQERGFNVIDENDPDKVLDLLIPDGHIVLLDMKLDGVHGLDVLKKIRSRHTELPVVLITGFKEEMIEAIEMGMKIGAQSYLYKPLEIEELLRVLGDIRRGVLARVLEHGAGKPNEEG